MGENIYMLPSDMNLNIRSGTARYNKKILVSDDKIILGKNDKVNSLVLEPVTSTLKMKSHAQPTHDHESQKPTITHKKQEPQTITYNEEKIALVLFLASGFAIWNMFK